MRLMESAFLGNVLATRQLVGKLVWDRRRPSPEWEPFEAWKAKAGIEVKDLAELAGRSELKGLDERCIPSGFSRSIAKTSRSLLLRKRCAR